MKNNKAILILFLLLAIIVGYLLYSKKTGTLQKELSDFAVSDTAAIDKIFMADREGNTVTLLRKDGSWTVNDKYMAKPEGINILLYTIKSVEVRSPVGKHSYNTIIKLMATKSTKIEIYQHGQLVKTYYVGDATMDNLGTYMYLENSSVPFITHIPGFNGFLSTRYYAQEQNWRDKGLLRTNPDKIASVKIQYLTAKDSMLEIKKLNENEYSISDESQTLKNYDKLKLNKYLSACATVFYEKLDHEMKPDQRDSILQKGAFIHFTINAGKQLFDAKFYRKPVTATSRSQYDEATGKIWDYDLDRFYLILPNDTSWYECQYFQYDRLLKTPAYFLADKQTK